MKFEEARRQAKNGDKLRLPIILTNELEKITEIIVGEKGCFNLSWEQYDSDQWEIIRAEPKVLTEDELWDGGHFMHGVYDEVISVTTFRRIFRKAHQNGRLERDIELRPLVDKVKELCSDANNFVAYSALINCGLILDLIEDTPPLNKEDDLLKRQAERAL